MTDKYQKLAELENSETRNALQARLDIGAEINRLVIETGYTHRRLITEYRKQRGSLAKCEDYYVAAARMDSCFTAVQRENLMKKLVPVDVALALAAEKYYDAAGRSEAIKYIVAGRLGAPWGKIKGSDKWKRENVKRLGQRTDRSPKRRTEDGANNPDNIVIPLLHFGVLDVDQAQAALDRLVSELARAGKDVHVMFADTCRRVLKSNNAALLETMKKGGVKRYDQEST